VNAAERLHAAGQSLWLDYITRGILDDGTLARYITDYAVTGLTSNPTIFDKAIEGSDAYDPAIRDLARAGLSGEDLFFSLAIDDITRAAGLFRSIWDDTDHSDGWVSLEVSPTLADDTEATIAQATSLHARAATPNVFIKIPGTPAGIPAIEEAIAAGVSVNVTLLFDREQYLAAAGAYMRGLERRREQGLHLDVSSVASVFMSRWDVAGHDALPPDLRNTLGVAVGKRIYAAYRGLLDGPEWGALRDAGARPQRLLWASTGTKDKALSDTFYVEALAAPLTVNTMPEGTLLAMADHGEVGALLEAGGGDGEEQLARITAAGVDIDALARTLQVDGAAAFVTSWESLLGSIGSRTAALAGAR
jgi:transaldolase